jgi:hypothetical protein
LISSLMPQSPRFRSLLLRQSSARADERPLNEIQQHRAIRHATRGMLRERLWKIGV